MKAYKFVVAFFMGILILFCSCTITNKNSESVVNFNGTKYEKYQGTLIQTGNLSAITQQGHITYYNNLNKEENGENINVNTYEGDSSNIFILVGQNIWNEGVVFHKKADILPRITDGDRISSISVNLPNDAKPYYLSSQAKTDYIRFLSKIINSDSGLVIIKTDGSPGEGSVITNYKNYPAYDSSINIKSISNGRFALNFSESDKNKRLLKDTNNAVIIPNWLIYEIKKS
ncbi:MAG: hypothetical protein Q8876_01475 [Bacillota bacterium]|nr:hypothetical protein [Bacillota bacterium]